MGSGKGEREAGFSFTRESDRLYEGVLDLF